MRGRGFKERSEEVASCCMMAMAMERERERERGKCHMATEYVAETIKERESYYNTANTVDESD